MCRFPLVSTQKPQQDFFWSFSSGAFVCTRLQGSHGFGPQVGFERIYSGRLDAGDSIYNVTQDKDERVARLFRLHAGHREKIDAAFAGDMVAAAGMKFARTGDTLATTEAPIILEQIADYKPVISLA